jgi:hypothetical protein
MRARSSGDDLFLKLPEILEDVARATENTIKHPPKRETFAMWLAWIVGQVEAESRTVCIKNRCDPLMHTARSCTRQDALIDSAQPRKVLWH